jgi:hypothetical protein
LLNFAQCDKPVASNLRSLAAGFTDTGIEKAAAKQGKKSKNIAF